MFSRQQTKSTKSHNGKTPFLCLLACWRRRQFYIVQHDTVDDESVPAGDKKQPDRRPASPNPPAHYPTETYFQKPPKPPLAQALTLKKSHSTDSFQASIESMDSLVESYWDPGDDFSHVTEIASNKRRGGGQGGENRRQDFLIEHLNFLSTQTQPREVEQVYATGDDSNRSHLASLLE